MNQPSTMMHPQQISELLRHKEWSLVDAHRELRAGISSPIKLLDAVLAYTDLTHSEVIDIILLSGGKTQTSSLETPIRVIEQIEEGQRVAKNNVWVGWPWNPEEEEPE